MCSSYSLLVTVVLFFLLITTTARLSHTRNKRTIDERRETLSSSAAGAKHSNHQRPSRRHLSSSIPDSNTKSTDAYRDSNSFDWHIANASVSLSAFAYCANDTIVSFKVYSHYHFPFAPVSIYVYTYYLLPLLSIAVELHRTCGGFRPYQHGLQSILRCAWVHRLQVHPLFLS